MTSAILVGVLGLSLTSCSGKDGDGGGAEGSDQAMVGAGEICEGTFASPGAREALAKVTKADRFAQNSVGDGLDKTVSNIVSDYELSGPSKGKDSSLCHIYAGGPSDLDDMSLRFALDDGESLDSTDQAPQLTSYSLGRRALAGNDYAALYFPCASSKMGSTSDDPAVVSGVLRVRLEPRGDVGELSKANMTVLNAAAFAVAKRLGCAGNGGLTETPVLKPVVLKPTPT
ncbi:hypothetical protein NBG84_28985 [Streptomyces sp. CWNU-1]|uniref:Lipoprotein n=2 Tax=Streptomyces albipurpureus TaxID=2897419 RepID=A0ABT0UW12_9ACTN|nr:hypothetical protein [Streptomyces sp. CWNU-1]